MMYNLIVSPRFKRSYKKFIKKQPFLKDNIDFAILEIAKDPFNSILNTHKLSGELFELYACKCGYNCRIVFSIEKGKTSENAIIILVDIGTHEDVY